MSSKNLNSSANFKEFSWVLAKEHEGVRIDSLLTTLLAQEVMSGNYLEDRVSSRSQIEKWIQEGYAFVNSEVIRKPSAKLKAGSHLQINIPSAEELSLEPDRDVSFEIVYEDDSLLVIDKPPGLVVHPGAGIFTGTLVHGLISHLGDDIRAIGDTFRPGIVHRLDKDTSGLLLVAKTEKAHREISKQFIEPRTIHRKYLALCQNIPREGETSGSITFPIGRHPAERTKMAVVEKKGKAARTDWKLKKAFSHGALLELTLYTGRTHQIRVHLSALGAPILGDILYGGGPQRLHPSIRSAVKKLGRQALHAFSLSFIHPETNIQVEFSSPLPDDFQCLLESCH